VPQGEKIALRLLSRRWLTRKKLAEKLAARGIELQEIQQTCQRMAQLGYLDDERYARAWLREKLAAQKWGPLRLRPELIRQGISPELADGLVKEAFPQGEESQLALAVAKKLSASGGSSDWRQKLGAALFRRGFAPDVIWRVLDLLAKENFLDRQ
jgi:regulatory protein